MVSNLRIGIDFHGVITDNPIFFRDFTKLAIEKGHEIYIISGGPSAEEKKFLDEYQIGYTTIFSLLDYFDKRGLVKYSRNGKFRVSDKLWDKAKAEYCRIHDISIQIDDTARYAENFSTPFCLYNPSETACIVCGEPLIFKDSPSKTLEALEKYLSSRK